MQRRCSSRIFAAGDSYREESQCRAPNQNPGERLGNREIMARARSPQLIHAPARKKRYSSESPGTREPIDKVVIPRLCGSCIPQAWMMEHGGNGSGEGLSADTESIASPPFSWRLQMYAYLFPASEECRRWGRVGLACVNGAPTRRTCQYLLVSSRGSAGGGQTSRPWPTLVLQCRRTCEDGAGQGQPGRTASAAIAALTKPADR
jgi:hypothetical protein